MVDLAALSELDILALTIHHEAGGEGLLGMLAVGCVIRNRAAWKKWGDTIRMVCLAPKQFSCWSPAGGPANFESLTAHADQIAKGQRPPAMSAAYQAAHAVYGPDPDVTQGADHYYAPAAMVPKDRMPIWAKGKTPTAHIGGHIFYRLRPREGA